MSARSVPADDHAGREQRIADQREKEGEVADVDHAALEAVEMRDDGKPRNGVYHRWIRPAREEIGYGVEAGEDEEEANHHRDDERHHLVTRHRGGHAGDGEVRAREEEAAEIAGEDDAVIQDRKSTRLNSSHLVIS